jgi:metal-responsive CopG/Arc/MetJ family transcriptional regulator
MVPGMTRITCKLPEKLAARLDSVARAEKRPKSAILRDAVEQRLKSRRLDSNVSAYDLMKQVVGTLEGPSDLATNPAHMKGFGE